tara:strand:+ start:28 stop:891 length:864 start_codon:yes stop_codon:yes gene_type:complete
MSVHRRSPARLVPEFFEPSTDLAPDEYIRDCLICQQQFIIDLLQRSEKRRLYCGDPCKEKGSTIRQYQKKNGYAPDVTAYVKDKGQYPPINMLTPLKKGDWGPSVGPSIKITTTRYSDYAVAKTKANASNLELAIATAAAEAERTKRASIKLEEQELKLSQTIMETKKATADNDQQNEISKLMKKMGAIPLSETNEFPIAEDQVNLLRSGITHIVNNHLMIVERVLSGEVVWSPAQVSLFSKLLSKAVPDAATTKIPSTSNKSVSEMSITELEDLVRQSHPKVIPNA